MVFIPLAEQSKRLDQFNTQQVVVSSRWSPTPEQLHILEELYRRGTRTPSTEHIKHITAQLRRYGKIEGKNVFYWFQNHKARERQKRRRQLESPTSVEQQFNGDAESGNLKQLLISLKFSNRQRRERFDLINDIYCSASSQQIKLLGESFLTIVNFDLVFIHHVKEWDHT